VANAENEKNTKQTQDDEVFEENEKGPEILQILRSTKSFLK